MTSSEHPTYCGECGRANGASALRCIWCGVPLVKAETPDYFEPTRVEMDYMDGLDRLDDPIPVKVLIDAAGIEVTEGMPGSRTARIPAESIIDASTLDASLTLETPAPRIPLWRWLITPLGSDSPRRQPPAEKKQHDYVLLVRYRSEDETRTALFHRQDSGGHLVVAGIARIINLLARITRERTQTSISSE
jgi:hypothetical protein